MAQAWHYEKSGQRFGPITTNELKAMVGAGELLPTDLIWREGMKDWKPARFAKGLFPEVVSGASDLNENPVVNASEIKEKRPITNQSSGTAIDHTTIAPEKFSFKETAIAAAKLGAAQAERAKLLNVTLPQQYLAWGRHCLTASDMQAEFSEPILRLNQIQSEITCLKDHESSKANTLSEKARAASDYAVRSAQKAKLTFEHSSLLCTLGKAVYDKHGVSEGPENLTAPIQASLSRIESLDDQIDTLSQSKSDSWLTPSRFLIAALVLLALGGFWGWRMITSDRDQSKVAGIATTPPSANKSNLTKPDKPAIESTSNNEQAKAAKSVVTSTKQIAFFSDSELAEIRSDKHLSVLYAMENLTVEELKSYLKIKSTCLKNGIPWTGFNPNMLFLIATPGKEWIIAARRVGMSRVQYDDASISAMKSKDAWDLSDSQAREIVTELTGTPLEDY